MSKHPRTQFIFCNFKETGVTYKLAVGFFLKGERVIAIADRLLFAVDIGDIAGLKINP